MQHILQAILIAGGNPIRVGGCVRDELLGIQNKDTDIEVFGLDHTTLTTILQQFGKTSIVGESFGVIKLTTDTDDYDFSLPRRDNKTGRGHKGFTIEVDHTMTPAEAALRRDFTINAMGRGVDGELVDPFGGEQDLKNKVLRATSRHFGEDPLRVLRGFQFAARFGLTVEPRTLAMCSALMSEAGTIATERVWGEWEKWAVKGVVPSLGLRFLVDCNWVMLYPELVNLIGVPQDPVWHPEGCAWTHTLHVCDAAAVICDREGLVGEDRVVIMLAALCHDFGKALPENGGTTVFERDRWRSPGHAEVGVPLARRFLERIGCFERVIVRVLPLVAEHMVCATKESMGDRVVRRLAVRLGAATVQELLWVVEADHNGRPPLPGGLPRAGLEVVEVAKRLALESVKPRPIIMGRHLVGRGLVPGPGFKPVLDRCFEAQLDGVFVDEVGGLLVLDEMLTG